MITSLTINGLQVHPISPAAAAWTSVELVSGLGTPQPRAETWDRPRRHGAVDRTLYYPGRTIALTGRILAGQGYADADVVAALDAIKAACAISSDADMKIDFTRAGDANGWFIMARPCSSFDADMAPRSHLGLSWTLQFLAGDPRIYSDVLKTGTYDPSAAGTTGLDFLLSFLLSFGPGSSGGLLTVTNEGTFATPPTFTVSGPFTSLTAIDDQTTGKSIYFTGAGPVLVGSILTVDVAERTVLIDGASRPDVIDGTQTSWFDLPVGTSDLRLRGTGFSAGVSALSVSFRDARI